ncbi:hypothetical protein [Nocardiopsis alba]|uniref:hypothetical protein n=1 Tax=Nocardiopsis alba TaxID=53437 RepID=UPI0035DF5AC5
MENSFTGDAVNVIQAGNIHGDVTVVAAGVKKVDSSDELLYYQVQGNYCGQIGHEDGGVYQEADTGFTRIVLEAGPPDRAVVIMSARPVVTSWRPAQKWARVVLTAAALIERQFIAHLDGENPYLESVDGHSSFSLTANDPEVFLVTPRTSGVVEWYLELVCQYKGQVYNVVVNDRGQPFRHASSPKELEDPKMVVPGLE